MKVQNTQNSPAFSSRTVRTKKILNALEKDPVNSFGDPKAGAGSKFARLDEKDQKFVRSLMAYKTYVLKDILQKKLSEIDKFIQGKS